MGPRAPRVSQSPELAMGGPPQAARSALETPHILETVAPTCRTRLVSTENGETRSE